MRVFIVLIWCFWFVGVDAQNRSIVFGVLIGVPDWTMEKEHINGGLPQSLWLHCYYWPSVFHFGS